MKGWRRHLANLSTWTPPPIDESWSWTPRRRRGTSKAEVAHRELETETINKINAMQSDMNTLNVNSRRAINHELIHEL